MHPRSSSALLAAGIAGCLMPLSSYALEASVVVGHTAEYTTNSGRTADDEVSEWIHRPSINVALRQEGAQLDLEGAYRFERRIFEEDLFEDESALTGHGQLIWRMLPERLDFTIRNTRTETTQQSLLPQTPANRQTVSATDLGPTLRLRPRPNSEVQLEYLYTDVRANETATDSTRHTANLRYIVDLSSVRELTFAAGYTDVDYDDDLAADIDTTRGTVSLASTGGQVAYTLTGGYSRTRRDLGRDDVNGPILEVDATWSATALTTVQFQGRRLITDRSDSLLITAPLEFGEELRQDTDLNEVFTDTHATVTVTRPLGNNRLAVSLLAAREDYEDVLRDNERAGVQLTLSRDLSPRTSLSATLEAGRREFLDEDEEQDEYRGTLMLNHTLTRRLDLGFGARYEEWDSSDPGREFDEWVGMVSISYRLFERQ